MSARWIAGVALALGLTLSPGRASPASSVESPPAASARRFVRTMAIFQGRVCLGTFTDGLYEVDISPEAIARDPSALAAARPMHSSPRMINDLLVVGSLLYVAANEGVFVTADAVEFQRLRSINARSVTGLSTDGTFLYATTPSALWRVRVAKSDALEAVWWRPGGSRSLQGVSADAHGAWLASEDRGVIRFDGRAFVAYDRLAGLPSSWVVAIAGDGKGGAFAGTLRDGAIHIDGEGRWQRLKGLPSLWTVALARGEGRVCVGTQEGAACYEDGALTAGRGPGWSSPLALEGLPDSRVHAFLRVEGGLLVGTEGGVALVESR